MTKVFKLEVVKCTENFRFLKNDKYDKCTISAKQQIKNMSASRLHNGRTAVSNVGKVHLDLQ